MGSHSDKFNSLRQIFVRVLFKQLIIKMMKLAVLALCLIAAVVAEPEAEASPEAYYGSYGYGYAGYRGKRSADADPAVFYGAYAPYGYGYAPYAYAPYRLAGASPTNT